MINDKGIQWDIPLNPEIKFLLKAVSFYHMQKASGNVWAVNMDKSFVTAEKKSATDILITASNRATEAADNLLGSKIVKKI